MPRPMSSAMQAALAAGVFSTAVFVEIHFISGPVYLWSGVGPRVWSGKTWVGVGALGSVSAIDEGASIEARGILLTLSGIDPTLLPLVLEEFRPGLPALVHLGVFNGDALIADPIVSWAGRTDQPSISAGETATISISCENRLVDMNTAVDRRYTNDDQQRDHPGDLGFLFVPGIQEVPLNWGQTPTK